MSRLSPSRLGRGWLVVMGIALVVFTRPAFAVSQPAAAPDAGVEAQALFREVMSPFCPGLTLADCPSPQAFDLRGDITRRLQAGESRQSIVNELVASYGPGILSDPSDTPIGRILWGVPIVLSLLAAGALALFLRRVTRGERELPLPPAAGDAGTRLEEELAALD